jgi:hypothetical protein
MARKKIDREMVHRFVGSGFLTLPDICPHNQIDYDVFTEQVNSKVSNTDVLVERSVR